MNPSEQIDNLIAQHPDWRGATLAQLRRTILEVDPEISRRTGRYGSRHWLLRRTRSGSKGSPVWKNEVSNCVVSTPADLPRRAAAQPRSMRGASRWQTSTT
jgi:hypothetical protein